MVASFRWILTMTFALVGPPIKHYAQIRQPSTEGAHLPLSDEPAMTLCAFYRL